MKAQNRPSSRARHETRRRFVHMVSTLSLPILLHSHCSYHDLDLSHIMSPHFPSILTAIARSDSITYNLEWLPVTYETKSKICGLVFTALHALAASFLPQGHFPPPLVWTFTPEPPNPWGKECAPSIRADISLPSSISTHLDTPHPSDSASVTLSSDPFPLLTGKACKTKIPWSYMQPHLSWGT